MALGVNGRVDVSVQKLSFVERRLNVFYSHFECRKQHLKEFVQCCTRTDRDNIEANH